jgi:hypothetical protein
MKRLGLALLASMVVAVCVGLMVSRCDLVDTEGICPKAGGKRMILENLYSKELSRQPWVTSISSTGRLDCNKYSDGTSVSVNTSVGVKLV